MTWLSLPHPESAATFLGAKTDGKFRLAVSAKDLATSPIWRFLPLVVPEKSIAMGSAAVPAP